MQLSSDLQISANEVEGKQDLTLLTVAGRINLGNADQLDEMAQAMFAAGSKYVLLDLSQTDSLTSAGLRTILVIYKLFQGQDKGATQVGRSPYLKILAPSPQIRQVLKIAGYETYLDIFEDRQAALDAFA